jgi:2-iminobutanoate/2-iminopropanoate deaminase
MPKRAVTTGKAAPAGGPYSHAVVAGDTVYLRDFNDFPEMNEIYREYINGEHLPVRTTLPVPLAGFDIEIDAILHTGP